MIETAQELRDQAAKLLARSVALDNQQLSKADLKTMSPAEISEAHHAGRFDVLMGVNTSANIELISRAKTEPITIADVKALSAIGQSELIVKANAENRIIQPTTKEVQR